MSHTATAGRLKTAALLASAIAAALPAAALAQDVSAPAILQWFDGSYTTIERRMPDYFMAGYGGLWTPPPTRADSGNGSVGYDVYNRFDLGSAGNATQYGTENGLTKMISEVHKTGGKSYLDLIWNHDGFSQWKNNNGTTNTGFINSGGYPGFKLGAGNGDWGDFHDPSATGDENEQLSGLIDIDQSTNNQYIRNPVNAGDSRNLPAGTTPQNGRIANVPTAANARFYQDQTSYITVTDPRVGPKDSQGNPIPFKIYNFTNNPNGGTPVVENATGYLMRNARWLIQDTGADGFRLDATKNYPDWVLNYFDQAVYGAIQTPLLNGAAQPVFSFGEAFDTSSSVLQPRIRKDGAAGGSVVGGNRDTLDFPLYYAMQTNLSSNGTQNDWRNVVNASIDVNDDGLANNGSQGVAFVQSHDGSGSPPYLANVAYAYTLLRPGNAIVYFNGNEFGTRGNNFPQQGRGDALGGQYGTNITKLLNIRNSYGRGDYKERWLDQNTLVFERENSVIAAYNSRLDNGYDTRTFNTAFAPGMHLVELTGNATNATVDPNNDIYDTVVVNSSGQVTIRIPRNKNPNGVEHDKGYVMYGPATPQGTLTDTNVARVLPAETQTASNNGTARLTPIDIIKANSFTLNLQTTAVTLSDGFRDRDADGDNALLKVDGGIDVNGNGHVDYTDPGTNVANNSYKISYGFEDFVTHRSPLYGTGGSTGDGLYSQTIDTTTLSEGYHYITARAFRHRSDGGPAVFTDFKKVVYVDRFRPAFTSQIVASSTGQASARDVLVTSTDETATGVTVLNNSGGGLTLDQVANAGENSQQPVGQYDRDAFRYGITGLHNGNNVFTTIVYEASYDPTQDYTGGGVSIQRVVGVNITTGSGLGLGDCDFNGSFTTNDASAFGAALSSNGSTFNPAADLNADGLNDEADNMLMVPWLTYKGANLGTISGATDLRLSRAIALDGTLNIPGGTLHIADGSNGGLGTDVPSVGLTFLSLFNIPANRTITKTGAQTLTINAPQSPGVNAVLAIAQGTANINTNGGVNLTVDVTAANGAAQVNFGATQNIKALSIDAAGASASVVQAGTDQQFGGKVLRTRSLTIASGASLDLTNNNLIVDYTGNTVLGDIQSKIHAGQITSTPATSNHGLTALGSVEASEQLNISGTQTAVWSGQIVDSSSILVKYTYGGDATLDGKINVDDYIRIDGGIAAGLSGWSNGDFNYDGKVNIDDYTIIDGTIGIQGAVISSAAGADGGINGGVTAIPEPASIAMLGITAAAAMCLRRRRSSKGMR